MTITEFVRNLWEADGNGSDGTMMDVETAKIDLENLENLPDGITPESYTDAWNELVMENR